MAPPPAAAAAEVLSLETAPEFNRAEQVNAFESMKTGVKGLVDAGITTVPKMFVRPPAELDDGPVAGEEIQPPVINLEGLNESPERRKQILEELKDAAGTWGIFQLVNHGIAPEKLQQTIDAVRRFHEQEAEVKREWYSRDWTRNVRFLSNLDLLFSKNADWMDTLMAYMPGFEPEQLPPICKEEIAEHIEESKKLARTTLELLCEGLGLPPNRLHEMECDKPGVLYCHYYPPCPEPDKTLGGKKHTDPFFLTLVLQDQIGGLQAFYNDQWVYVRPVEGAILINVGDLLQIVSNDRYKSPLHRVKTRSGKHRVSAVFFFGANPNSEETFAPFDELVSEDNPAKYKPLMMKEYMAGMIKGRYSPVANEALGIKPSDE